VPAHIKLTPTFKGGKGGAQIGYCGVTTALPMEKLEAVRPPIALSTRIFAGLVITRAPFLTATLASVFVALGVVLAFDLPLSWLAFALAAVGAVAMHVAANTFNDVFDWESGADPLNNDYFMPFSGGSRSIELGLITLKGLRAVAISALLVGALCGGALMLMGQWVLLGFGLVGAFAAYFYTAPPIRLAARRGLGELFVGLCFGPLMTAGVIAASTGVVDARAFLVGVPVGLLVTAILWANEIPDAKSDALVGKNHLVVTLGMGGAKVGYALLLVGAAASHIALVALAMLPVLSLAALVPLLFNVKAALTIFNHAGDRQCITASRDTIIGHALYGTVLTLLLALS
jgi:1,4-dihydroxy-2-naphthoate polyprenyltransferase